VVFRDPERITGLDKDMSSSNVYVWYTMLDTNDPDSIVGLVMDAVSVGTAHRDPLAENAGVVIDRPSLTAKGYSTVVKYSRSTTLLDDNTPVIAPIIRVAPDYPQSPNDLHQF
jgi:hypothetical protein